MGELLSGRVCQQSLSELKRNVPWARFGLFLYPAQHGERHGVEKLPHPLG
jgi:hypothetical protein